MTLTKKDMIFLSPAFACFFLCALLFGFQAIQVIVHTLSGTGSYSLEAILGSVNAESKIGLVRGLIAITWSGVPIGLPLLLLKQHRISLSLLWLGPSVVLAFVPMLLVSGGAMPSNGQWVLLIAACYIYLFVYIVLKKRA